MRIYKITIEVQDNVYFATREAGKLYETEKYIHNYALTYALGLVKDVYFHHFVHVPRYKEDLKKLKGIYVTPASPINIRFNFLTFKFGSEKNHIKEEKLSKNIPNFGKLKELAVESKLVFFIFIDNNSSTLPSHLVNWLDSGKSLSIRLGKWMSKAELKAKTTSEMKRKKGEYLIPYALNPLDLPQKPDVFDIVSMPPVSLIKNARLKGEFIEAVFEHEKEKLILPLGMEYFKIETKNNLPIM